MKNILSFILLVIAAILIWPLAPNVLGSSEEVHITTQVYTADPIKAVAITNDNRYIFSGSDENLRMWDLSEANLAKTFKGHTKDIYSVTLSPDNKYVLTGDESGVLKIWDILKGKEIKTIKAHDAAIFTIGMSANGRYMLTGCYDGTIKVWDYENDKVLRKFIGKEYSLAVITKDGKQVIGEKADGSIVIWSVRTGEIEKIIKLPNEFYRVSLYSPDSKYAIIERFRETSIYPELWKLNDGRKIRNFNFTEYEKNYISFISMWGSFSWGAFSPDGKIIVSMFIDGKKYVLWDIDKDQPIRVFHNEHYEAASATVFSTDGKYIVSGSIEAMTRLWNVATGKEIIKMIGLKSGDWVMITPEGYYNASSKADEQIIFTYDINKKCSLNNHRETFFRPDLVKDVLSGKSLNDYKKISDIPIPVKCRSGN